MTVELMHATAVAIDGQGVLLLGPSGSGKSDLALRLIDRGAQLISDDAVPIEVRNGLPVLLAPANIAGKLEVRGIGIVSADHIASAPLRLMVQIANQLERMPPDDIAGVMAGYSVPLFHSLPFEASAPIKLEYALRAVIDAERWPVPLDGTEAATGSRTS